MNQIDFVELALLGDQLPTFFGLNLKGFLQQAGHFWNVFP